MEPQQMIELLQAKVAEDDESFFRVLVDGRSIKYITIETGIYSIEDMCFGTALASILPELPPGDWNDGLVARGSHDGQPYFASTKRTEFQGVENTWHETSIDYMDLSIGKKLRTGIYEVTCPLFHETIVAKSARLPWEIQYMENETTAYQWTSGHDIGPQFLGHLTENGRVFGFLMERVKDARHAQIQDIEACRGVLCRLHRLGVRHGDTNRLNFLVGPSKVILIDFDTARKCDDENVLLQEMDDLTKCFEDTSGRGGLKCSFNALARS